MRKYKCPNCKNIFEGEVLDEEILIPCPECRFFSEQIKEEKEMKYYRKIELQPMRPYVPGEDMDGVSVSKGDVLEEGGMIAWNPDKPDDLWYVAKEFMKKYEEVEVE